MASNCSFSIYELILFQILLHLLIYKWFHTYLLTLSDKILKIMFQVFVSQYEHKQMLNKNTLRSL